MFVVSELSDLQSRSDCKLSFDHTSDGSNPTSSRRLDQHSMAAPRRKKSRAERASQSSWDIPEMADMPPLLDPLETDEDRPAWDVNSNVHGKKNGHLSTQIFLSCFCVACLRQLAEG